MARNFAGKELTALYAATVPKYRSRADKVSITRADERCSAQTRRFDPIKSACTANWSTMAIPTRFLTQCISTRVNASFNTKTTLLKNKIELSKRVRSHRSTERRISSKILKRITQS